MASLAEICDHLGKNMDELNIDDYDGGNLLMALVFLLTAHLDGVGHPISVEQLDEMFTTALAVSIDIPRNSNG